MMEIRVVILICQLLCFTPATFFFTATKSQSDKWIHVHKSAGQVLWPTSHTSVQNTWCSEGIRSAWSAFTLRSTCAVCALKMVQNLERGPMDTLPPPRMLCWRNNGNYFTSFSTLDTFLATAAHFTKALTLRCVFTVNLSFSVPDAWAGGWLSNCHESCRHWLFAPRC